MRKIIFHYHLFKNAGTSLDAALKENFTGDTWVTAEFPPAIPRNRQMVQQWVGQQPQAKCFSSHTAVLTLAPWGDVDVVPVIFVRHPIDRMASAYAFEKKQGGDGFGAVLARNTTLAGYIETRLALGYDRQCRDFHVHRFAQMYGAGENELDNALLALKELPFVGLVEKYDQSLQKLQALLIGEGFEGIQLQVKSENTSRDHKASLESKLAKIREDIGDELYDKLEQANSADLMLYRAVCELY